MTFHIFSFSHPATKFKVSIDTCMHGLQSGAAARDNIRSQTGPGITQLTYGTIACGYHIRVVRIWD